MPSHRSPAPAPASIRRRRPAAPGGPPAVLSGNFRHRNLPLLLLQARERVLSQFRPLLNARGLTEQQWRIVRALLDTGALEPREIVLLCGISSPSLTGVLARMEELGLVVRERLEHDQRRVRVSLTPLSRRLAAAMAQEVDATYDRLEAKVGQARLRALVSDLDELLALLVDPQGLAED